MIRKLDKLGRIVIPIEFRIKNNWNYKDPIDIIEYDNEIILRKDKGTQCEKCKTNICNTDNYCSNCGKKIK